MQLQQKVLNARSKKMKEQPVRLRPDEKVEAPMNKRYRGSNIKLSTHGPKRQHRKSRRA